MATPTQYIKRTVTSAKGIPTQSAALVKLQEHPAWKVGTKIVDIERNGDRWVAKIEEPRVAAPFPPKEDDNEETEAVIPSPDGENDSSDSSDESDSGDSEKEPSGPPEAGDKPKKEKASLDEVVELLHQVLKAVGGPGLDGDVPPPLPGPDGPPGPPGAGKPPAGAPIRPPKLKPGEAPPGSTPVGAPAFASVHGKVATFNAKTPDPQRQIKIAEAKAELETEFAPYKVKQIIRERDTGTLHAQLSVR